MATSDTQSDEMLSSGRGEGGVEEEEIESRVGISYTLFQIRRDPTALAGLAIISLMTVIAVFAYVDAVVFNYLAEYSFFANLGVEQYWFARTYWMHPENDPSNVQALLPPAWMENTFGTGTWEHPLGTDHRGRDILVRLFYGTRIAIQVGFISTVIGMVGGTLVGAVAGYYGGWIDDALMRGVETLYAIPFLVLVIAFMAAFGRDLTYAMVGVGITTIPVFSRLIRSRVVSVREEDYIEAARAAGVRDRNIILRHVIPNSFAPVLVQATLQIGVSILIVAGLSFLGYGVQPPKPSWGQMLSNSRGYMLPNPWFSVWPGIAILITVVGFNLLGDGLRDALDPRVNN
ncbi:ABC transporter permease [Halostella sp. JP-L12]|uniref:ABC transporter permease n=1 Tax=Halostella TaxID=1843185 RepID=UPI000EF84AEA|nr:MULTISPECIES: ABC transporter permease [Halostella]NHN46871.1 ABC transporter permease [Halostella sp. JP-L12]